MSDEERPTSSASIAVRLFPGFLTVLFLVLAATGNCAVCGLDRDYVGEAVSK